jgi:hypothetical protein
MWSMCMYFYTRINHHKGEYKIFDTHFVIYLICLKQKHKKDEPLPWYFINDENGYH